ncbi:Hypothetical_protein [Hexamita inflata]|uniref:Hypothetical_protein n=1 Tax=Hexamita inflata TaxID=28002 RepID=A0AA86PI34_9EUKA|nr:Hypothetical protein HINF_LOCUS27544 [Hexamita inflata]
MSELCTETVHLKVWSGIVQLNGLLYKNVYLNDIYQSGAHANFCINNENQCVNFCIILKYRIKHISSHQLDKIKLSFNHIELCSFNYKHKSLLQVTIVSRPQYNIAWTWTFISYFDYNI